MANYSEINHKKPITFLLQKIVGFQYTLKGEIIELKILCLTSITNPIQLEIYTSSFPMINFQKHSLNILVLHSLLLIQPKNYKITKL